MPYVLPNQRHNTLYHCKKTSTVQNANVELKQQKQQNNSNNSGLLGIAAQCWIVHETLKH